MTPSEKYKAKPVVDVFLYRGGVWAGAGIDGLFAVLGLGLVWVAVRPGRWPAMWIVLSIGMGRAQARRVTTRDPAPPNAAEELHHPPGRVHRARASPQMDHVTLVQV